MQAKEQMGMETIINRFLLFFVANVSKKSHLSNISDTF